MRKIFALSFVELAEKFTQLPVWFIVSEEYGPVRHPEGLSNTNRIRLLIEWWEASKDLRFSNAVLELARSPIDSLDPWRDGKEVIELIADLREGYFDEL